jgi:indole-3-glycerol phosphate synthase
MILDDIAAATKKRVAAARAICSYHKLKAAALEKPCQGKKKFEQALRAPGLSFICEVKRASPSKGLIAPDFPYLQIARAYQDAGAAAISVLTEPDFFMGSDIYLRELAADIDLPMLRKDFVLDEYQICEARLLGASAILLIVALLDDKKLAAFIKIAEDFGLAALVETHSEDELARALDSGASLIGINNRDLRTFKVDLSVTARLAERVPAGLIVVAESGVHTREDVVALGTRVDAVLVGEALMRAADKRTFLQQLKAP